MKVLLDENLPHDLRPLILGTLHRWMESSGKLGGQHKCPLCANHWEVLDGVVHGERAKERDSENRLRVLDSQENWCSKTVPTDYPTPMFDSNRLYFGDNLTFLSDPDEFPSESVDLVYLDPPFNSNASYNVLFKDAKGTPSQAQIKAFDDTWTWDQSANQALAQLMHDKHTPGELAALVKTFHSFLGHSPMLAYLVQMAVRLVHLRRVLKPTGSLYLHCDPTASHYLKLVLDGIFGPERFCNEIVWRRTGAHTTPGRFESIHDTILFYKCSTQSKYNKSVRPYMKGHVEKRYAKDATGRLRFRSGGNILTGPGRTEGESGATWRGFNPSAKNRHWAIPGRFEQRMPDAYKKMGPLKKLDALFDAGWIEIIEGRAWPEPVWFLDDTDGQRLSDIWAFQPYSEGTVFGCADGIDEDVKWMGPTDPERLGYPTQKPIGLLKRVIRASSNPGDVILDPFCGCGTTIDAVETLNRENPDKPPRRWIGIDITHLAINLIKSRLSRFDPVAEYEIIGEPVSVDGAQALFDEDPYQFQFWACGLVGARPAGSAGGKKGKKGADRGIDGERSFVDGNKGPCSMLVQVKGGKPKLADVRDFRGVIEREDAAVGIFVSLHVPTPKMRAEAAAAGTFMGVNDEGPVPRLQIVTVETLLQGGTPAVPSGLKLPRDAVGSSDVTLRRAKKHDDASLFQRRAKD